MELAQAYADVLPASHRQALAEAANELIDTTMRDLEASDTPDWSNDNWLIGTFLPPRYIPRYTAKFAQRFFACLMTIVWKLGQREPIPLSCTAEELAAHILIEEAEALLEMKGIEADFGDLYDMLFEDVDFEFLYEGAHDGIETTELAEEMGIVHLDFESWFERFGLSKSSGYPEVHPAARSDP